MKATHVVGELLGRLGEKWTLPVLDALDARPLRYTDLRRRLRLTAKVLTRVLRRWRPTGSSRGSSRP